jgi:hypothetical protein
MGHSIVIILLGPTAVYFQADFFKQVNSSLHLWYTENIWILLSIKYVSWKEIKKPT